MRTKRPLREPVREAPGPKAAGVQGAPTINHKNYITPAGFQRLNDEHRFLLNRERPAVTKVVAWAASNGDRSENADYLYAKRRLRQIDSRIRFLTKRIDAAEIVDPAAPRSGAAATRAFFGATVTYRILPPSLRSQEVPASIGEASEHVVCIVGIDEVDLNRRYISWMSPLARALMKSSPGDQAVLRAPKKTEHLEIIDVGYVLIPMDPYREPPGAESAARNAPSGVIASERNAPSGVIASERNAPSGVIASESNAPSGVIASEMRRSDVHAIIEQLGLEPHPERGYYRETYRASSEVQSVRHRGSRLASTAIYFLVTANEPTTFLHRLVSDEVFHLYDGGPLEIVRLFPDGQWDVAVLGMNLAGGERPQVVVPAGTWFGTELRPGASHCLVGCTVAPGFDFADFELAQGPELATIYPAAADRIRRMTRP